MPPPGAPRPSLTAHARPWLPRWQSAPPPQTFRPRRSCLEGLLASRQGKLSDLIEVEEQLSSTQGEIDAARSELAMMRTRVAASEMTLDYSAPATFGAIWAPVTQATKGATGVFAGGVGIVITVFAAIAPLAFLGGLIALLARWFSKRKVGSRAGRKD